MLWVTIMLPFCNRVIFTFQGFGAISYNSILNIAFFLLETKRQLFKVVKKLKERIKNYFYFFIIQYLEEMTNNSIKNYWIFV